MNLIETKINSITATNYIEKINDILENYELIVSEKAHKGTSEQKHFGIYYTNYIIAYKITEEAFQNFNTKKIEEIKFFEPSVGLGIFVITYLDYINKNFKLTKEQVSKIINNIYLSDIDENAISLAKQLIERFIQIKFNYKLCIKEKNIFIGDTLVDETCNMRTMKELFNDDIKFDFILSNPPYLNVKAQKKNMSEEEYQSYREYCKVFSKKIKKSLTYQDGTINLYKVFLELILNKYTNENAHIGVIVPYSLLSDKSTTNLRKHLLGNTDLSKIFYLNEGSKQFRNITQAMCFFGCKKEQIQSDNIELMNFEKSEDKVLINTDNLKQIDSNFTLNKICEKSYDILLKLHKHNKLKDISEIKNLRGELDLSNDKKYVSNEKTEYMLLQGRNIKEWSYTDNELYANNSFLSSRTSPKFQDIKKDRIICQQISNIHSKKRLKFSKIPANIILGNSCNYITSESIPINYLLGLFNSYLFDWRFKLFSSNNHINNYELDDIPIVIDKDYYTIEKLVNKILQGDTTSIIDLNMQIFKSYSISNNEIITVMKNYDDSIAKGIMSHVEKQAI